MNIVSPYLEVDVRQNHLEWTIFSIDHEVLESGNAEHFDNIRAMQTTRGIVDVIVDSGFRTQEVFEAAHAYGWHTFKATSKGPRIINPHLLQKDREPLANVPHMTPQIDQLRQLIKPTFDGDIIGKEVRDYLCVRGLVSRRDGWNFLTPEGVGTCVTLGFLRP